MTTKNVELDNNGDAIITLGKPMNIGGVEVSALKMREPTVRDQLAVEAMKGSDAEKEIFCFSTLTGQAPSDLHSLTLRDYKRVQEAYNLFTV